MPRRRKVALLIDSSAFGRALVRGVGAYSCGHGQGFLLFDQRAPSDLPPRWLADWDGQGILACISDREVLEMIVRTGLPAIDLRGTVPPSEIPFVGLDSQTTARMAFDHLRQRGFRHFAFCGSERRSSWLLDQRATEFEAIVVESHFSCNRFPPDHEPRTALAWTEEQRQLAEWVIDLPKPVGILACHDDRAFEVLNACRDVQVAVPEDVAVIGINNDDALCALSNPPLSSIDPNAEQIGYNAAVILDHMMVRNNGMRGNTFVEPLGVVARRSTDACAIDDPALVRAMRFIREHACDGINVDDVLRHVSLSRSTLDRRFIRILGHSPSDEILRMRIERVQRLLTDTEYPLSMVADLAGFEHSEHMGALFRRRTGQTPGEYRETHRPPGRRLSP